jgi:hypothetical protein
VFVEHRPGRDNQLCTQTVRNTRSEKDKLNIPPVWPQSPNQIPQTSLVCSETRILKRNRTPGADKRGKKKKVNMEQSSKTHGQQTHRQLYHSIKCDAFHELLAFKVLDFRCSQTTVDTPHLYLNTYYFPFQVLLEARHDQTVTVTQARVAFQPQHITRDIRDNRADCCDPRPPIPVSCRSSCKVLYYLPS